jgi:hypothetical protein
LRFNSMGIGKNILLLASLLLSACAVRGTDEAAQFLRNKKFQGVVDFTVLKEYVLSDSCIRCHSDFSDEAGLVPYVVAGNPSASKLVLEVESGRMPKDAAKLSEESIQLVRNYVENLKQEIPLPPIEPSYASLRVHLFAVSCTKCHFTGNTRGRAPLDSYENVLANADDVEFRMLDLGDMPPTGRAPAVSDELKRIYLEWKARGFPR